jgi:hypothetical protein
MEQVNGFIPTISDYREYRVGSQIHTITDELVTQMSSAVEPADQDMMSIAEVVFASPACWNASFLLPNGQHTPSTWKNMGVDLELVRHVDSWILLQSEWKSNVENRKIY